MSLAVVVAHFDFARRIRPHFRRSLENYASSADRVVVVSTSGASEEDVSGLPRNVMFATKPNFGYDFYSYKWGLDLIGDYAQFDRIVITNDSFVGPVVKLSELLESSAVSNADFCGMTKSLNHGGHIQSFFFTFTSAVSRSRAFTRFWKDMEPISDRSRVIQKYEVGMSRCIEQSGFRIGAYFNPDRQDRETGRNRWNWYQDHRLTQELPPRVLSATSRGDRDEKHLNPAVAYADRILDGAALPLLKFDTLRFDPYELGSQTLLTACEKQYPNEFRGVRAFLHETKAFYPYRPGEINLPATKDELVSSGVGYTYDSKFLGKPFGAKKTRYEEVDALR